MSARQAPGLVGWREVSRAICAAALCGSCQPPWSVQGTVVGEAVRTTRGAVVHATVRGTATFKCPHGEKKTQTKLLTTGTFSFSGEGVSFPMTCELEIASPGYVTFHEDFTHTCEHPDPPNDCRRASLGVELVPLSAPSPAPPPSVAPSAKPGRGGTPDPLNPRLL